VGPAGSVGLPGPAGGNGPVIVLGERARRGLDVSPVPVALEGRTSAEIATIAEGSYLVNAVGNCAACHNSPDGKFLAGGAPQPVDQAGHVVYRRNLTPEPATGLKLSEAEFLEAMRTGKDFRTPEGMPVQQLLRMPWPYFRWMSTDDLRAIYAYLRAIPAVANKVLPDNKGATLAALAPVPLGDKYTEGEEERPLPPELDANKMRVPDPDAVLRGLAIRPLGAPADLGTRPGAEQRAIGRGSYLVTIAHCGECHTNPGRYDVAASDPKFLKVNTELYLTGGVVWSVPPARQSALKQTRTMSANLTGQSNGYLHRPGADFARFLTTITQGVKSAGTPNARPLGFPMPFEVFRRMTLEDLEAVWAYLQSLPPRTGGADKSPQGVARYCARDQDCSATETCNMASNECIGASCAIAADCGACQACSGGKCGAPSPGDSCLVSGL
jgi:mono/diheme cytochrome c family protein